MTRTQAGTLTADQVGRQTKVQGWVHRRRDHGGVIFLDVRDRSGVVQAVVHPETTPEAAEALQPARLEWVVEVEGKVVRRDPDKVNPKMATGEIEIQVASGRVLGRSEPMPFGVEGAQDASEETRLKYRFLDLRRNALQSNLRLRSDFTIESLAYFREQGFVNVETPMLTRSTPEGARDYLVPSRLNHGNFYALPQSPQLFKQILMVSGLERYVQFARCFRDEDLRADRQPEFTQIDVEMSFVDEEDVYRLVEGLFARVFPLAGIEPPASYPRLSYDDAVLRYGNDRPDLRVDLEIEDVTDCLQETGFRAFQAATASGGVVRGVHIPGAASSSRRQVDEYADIARRHGAAGVLWVKRDGGVPSFLVKGALTDGQVETLADRLGVEEGGLGLLVAGPAPTAAAALGALRVEVGRRFGHMREDAHEFLWVHDFPLVTWNGDEGRWNATHHPFTSPRMEHLDRLESDPGSVLSRAYDVVLNGNEIGGGSIRIHDRDVQKRVLAVLGIDAAEAERRFGFLFEALSYGAPPHGGIALGVDRIVMLMAGAASLRDVIAFPKTASAVCLMTEAPSTVDQEQLLELGLRVRPRGG
ncbi:MAG: aspartate--tRNA ligase [Holophagales bacterium]|nr:aspartate--tRNA ligase [Holophagales bacterium]MYD22051.1 aspartate--tRNA ligase [Holophagales bacterium]MYI32886.1 aspartate--tRNA ligase [Holophagales bacterium]